MVDFVLSGPLHQWSIADRASCIGVGLRVEELAVASGWDRRSSGELCLMVIELASNALRHGRGGSCTVRISPESCQVVVEDSGPGFPGWVLERFQLGLSIEEKAGSAMPRARGLGAGLDAARRLSTTLMLENRIGAKGARAVAFVVRDGPRCATTLPARCRKH